MKLPSLGTAYLVSSGSIEFFRKVVINFEAFIAELDVLTIWNAFTECKPELKKKYGYGGKHLYPYGSFHPTKVLDKCLKEYSRGRISEKKLPFLRPKYIYSYSAHKKLASISYMIKQSTRKRAAQVTTLPIWAESEFTGLMLTFVKHDIEKTPSLLTHISWEETHEKTSYGYILEVGLFDGQYRVHQCVAEIQQQINNKLICDRYEYRIIPNQQGTERLFRNTFILN